MGAMLEIPTVDEVIMLGKIRGHSNITKKALYIEVRGYVYLCHQGLLVVQYDKDVFDETICNGRIAMH